VTNEFVRAEFVLLASQLPNNGLNAFDISTTKQYTFIEPSVSALHVANSLWADSCVVVRVARREGSIFAQSWLELCVQMLKGEGR
jgi:hypothetical protein